MRLLPAPAFCLVAACVSTAPSPATAPPLTAEAEPEHLELPLLSPRLSVPAPEPARMEAPEPPEPGPELPAAPYLAASAGARYPRRAQVAREGPLRLSLDGDAATYGSRRPLSMAVEGIVVEERPRSVRMVLRDERVRLVVYVRRDALQRVSAASTWLSTAAGRAPDPEGGVRIATGIPLEETEKQGSLRKVAGEVDQIHFEGWLPEGAVGEVFVPERFPTPFANGLLAEGTVITSPGGEVLARIPAPVSPGAPPGFHHETTLLPGAPPGMQAIHLHRSRLEVRGLVPASAAKKRPPGSDGWGFGTMGGGIGGMSDTEHALLRPGAGIYTEAGERVGSALRATDVWVSYGARHGKETLVWASFIFSSFGFLTAHVKRDDLRPYPGR